MLNQAASNPMEPDYSSAGFFGALPSGDIPGIPYNNQPLMYSGQIQRRPSGGQRRIKVDRRCALEVMGDAFLEIDFPARKESHQLLYREVHQKKS